tara:strand:+ start:105 stop:833 length:729 start_codon:yes stop_codon:yes gene_type:complete
VRIQAGVAKYALKASYDVLSQHVLDFLGIVVDMVRWVVNLVREVKLPKPMVPHNLAGTLPSGGSQGKAEILRKSQAIGRVYFQGSQRGSNQCLALLAGLGNTDAAPGSKVTKGDGLGLKIFRLKHLVNCLEAVFQADLMGSVPSLPPTRKKAMVRPKKKGSSKKDGTCQNHKWTCGEIASQKGRERAQDTGGNPKNCREYEQGSHPVGQQGGGCCRSNKQSRNQHHANGLKGSDYSESQTKQ